MPTSLNNNKNIPIQIFKTLTWFSSSQLNINLKRRDMTEDIEMFSYQIIFPVLQNVFSRSVTEFKTMMMTEKNTPLGTNEETKTKWIGQSLFGVKTTGEPLPLKSPTNLKINYFRTTFIFISLGSKSGKRPRSLRITWFFSIGWRRRFFWTGFEAKKGFDWNCGHCRSLTHPLHPIN